MTNKRAELICGLTFRIAIWSLGLCLMALFLFTYTQSQMGLSAAFIPTHPDYPTYMALGVIRSLLSVVIVLSLMVGIVSFLVRRVLRNRIADEEYLQKREGG